MQVWAEEQDIDIVVIQEPCKKMMGWNGYVWHGAGSSAKTATWAKRHMGTRTYEPCTDANICVIIVPTSEGEVAIVNIYDEPGVPAAAARWKKIAQVVDQINVAKVVVAGDMNAKSVVWGSTETDARGESILDDCAALGLLLANDATQGPTFVGPMGESYVDVTLYKSVQVVAWTVLKEESLSDHAFIRFDIQKGATPAKYIRVVRDLSRAKWQQIKTAVTDLPYNKSNSVEDIELASERIQTLLSEACKKYIPTKKRDGVELVWWNGALAEARTNSRKARKRAQLCKGRDDRAALVESWKHERAGYKKLIKEARASAIKDMLDQLSEDMSWDRVWEALRRLGAGKGERGIWKEDATYVIKESEIDEELVRKYHPPLQAEEARCLQRWRDTINKGLVELGDDDLISVYEVEDAITGLQNGKATGKDGIPNEALKETKDEMSKQMAELLNDCLRWGYFPKCWKVAQVVWLPKPKGGYRPISLLPALGRVADKLLNNRLKLWAEKNAVLSEQQYGFREGRSTTMALRNLIGIISGTPRKAHCMVVLLDLSNAFNMAWPPEIDRQLEVARAPSYMRRIIASFMTDRKVTSRNVSQGVYRGCPQGSSLGPTLWLVGMEDWFRRMSGLDACVQAFADDQCVVVTGPSVKALESKWAIIWEECKNWARIAKMHYNVAKTEAMFRSGTGRIRPPVLRADDLVFTVGSVIQYLGLKLDSRLSFMPHVSYIREKAAVLAPRITALLRTKKGRTKAVAREIYERAVKPALLYGAEVWGSNAGKIKMRDGLAAAQRLFLRTVVPCYRTTATVALQVLAGVAPLHIEARAIGLAYTPKCPVERGELLQNRWFPNERGKIVEMLCGNRNAEIKIYVDYSGEQNRIGIVQEGTDPELKLSAALTAVASTTQGEIAALLWGIERAIQLVINDGATVQILSDSRQAISAVIAGKPKAVQIASIQREIKRCFLAANGKMFIRWIPRRENKADQIRHGNFVDTGIARTVSQKPSKNAARALKRLEIRDRWQEEWDTESRGRELYRRCREVGFDRLELSFKGVQLATGHGNMAAYLRRFGLAESGLCGCGRADETVEHILSTCENAERARARSLALTFDPFRTEGKQNTQAINNWNTLAGLVLEDET